MAHSAAASSGKGGRKKTAKKTATKSSAKTAKAAPTDDAAIEPQDAAQTAKTTSVKPQTTPDAKAETRKIGGVNVTPDTALRIVAGMFKQRQAVEEARAAYLDAKEAAKEAKAQWEAAVQNLMDVLRPEPRVEADGQQRLPNMHDPDESSESDAGAADWRGLSIADSMNLRNGVVSALNIGGIVTVGQLVEKMREGGVRWYDGVRGVSKATADDIADQVAALEHASKPNAPATASADDQAQKTADEAGDGVSDGESDDADEDARQEEPEDPADPTHVVREDEHPYDLARPWREQSTLTLLTKGLKTSESQALASNGVNTLGDVHDQRDADWSEFGAGLDDIRRDEIVSAAAEAAAEVVDLRTQAKRDATSQNGAS